VPVRGAPEARGVDWGSRWGTVRLYSVWKLSLGPDRAFPLWVEVMGPAGLVVVMSAREVSDEEVGPREVGPREVGRAEVGPDEVGFGEVGVGEVGADEVGPVEVGCREAVPSKSGPSQGSSL
jgi:hypothetical protein